jgi:hypothetical protein
MLLLLLLLLPCLSMNTAAAALPAARRWLVGSSTHWT